MSDGHIRQRSPGSWEVRYSLTDEIGKRRNFTATVRGNRKVAERELRKRLAARDAGAPIDASRVTASAWFDRWLSIVKSEVANATFAHYSRAVASYLKPRFGSLLLTKITRAQVQQLFIDLATDGGRADGKPGLLAASTRKQIYLVLNICLNRALDLELIAANPAQVMRRRLPRAKAERVAVPTAEQSSELLDAARGHGIFAPILLALATGCRRSEAAALTWNDVDLDRGAVTIAASMTQIGTRLSVGPTKSGKSRVVTLGQNALEELRGWRVMQAQQLLLLGVRQTAAMPVCTRPDAERMTPNKITLDFLRLARRLGIATNYHALRHGHATQLLLAGVHPKVAQERLGHHSVAFTLDRYSHTIERLHDDAAAKIDGLFARR